LQLPGDGVGVVVADDDGGGGVDGVGAVAVAGGDGHKRQIGFHPMTIRPHLVLATEVV